MSTSARFEATQFTAIFSHYWRCRVRSECLTRMSTPPLFLSPSTHTSYGESGAGNRVRKSHGKQHNNTRCNASYFHLHPATKYYIGRAGGGGRARRRGRNALKLRSASKSRYLHRKLSSVLILSKTQVGLSGRVGKDALS